MKSRLTPVQSVWRPCPFQGGFDYGAFVNDRRQVCTRIWRPSRIESECVYGEGLQFLFPDANCNPFGQSEQLEVRMLCWGDWVEAQYRFVVIGEIGKTPQFVLRLPSDLDSQTEFPAQLYFSPLTPLTLDGSITVKVRRLLLRMKRSEPGVCYDESDKCAGFVQEGKCTNSALHKYANFCKRSCGVCDFVPSVKAECRFPSYFQGEWSLFETDRKETVRISPGDIEFDIQGKFICKSKHWNKDHFKLLSVFENGCRPRYSCIDFESEGSKILQYRISRSKFTDESFAMCEFANDPLPIGNKIRSAEMKILLAKTSIQWGACGLSGEVRVNATFSDGTSCNGKLTDWNQHTCQYRTKLSLEMEYCSHKQKQEFLCIAYMSVDDSFSILISRDDTEDRHFSCWTVHTYPESMSYKPWDLATKLPRAQCGSQQDMHAVVPTSSSIIVRTYNDRVQQPCHKGNGRKVVVLDEIHSAPASSQMTTAGPLPVRRTTRTPESRDGDYPDTKYIPPPRERVSNASCPPSSSQSYRTLGLLLALVICICQLAPC